MKIRELFLLLANESGDAEVFVWVPGEVPRATAAHGWQLSLESTVTLFNDGVELTAKESL